MTVPEQIQNALSHHQAGRLQQAEAIYRQILVQNPNNPTALYLLGTLAAQVGRVDDAINLISKAIAIAPNMPQYHGNLGAIYLKLQRYDQAIASLKSAIALDSQTAATHENLGIAYASIADDSNAITEFKKANECLPSWPEPPNSLGLIYQHQGKLNDSLAAFNRAIALDPNYAPAHLNIAMHELLLGHFETGWEKYEWRLKVPEVIVRKNLTPPQWTGADIRNKTILLHSEQGFGDIFQFVRYCTLVAQRGAKVILESPPDLANLLRSVDGISQVIPFGDPLPPFDTHSPLMSLPLIFQTRLDTIPSTTPYIHPRADLAADWSNRLGSGTRPRVGLVWAGRSTHSNNSRRSIPLAQFAPMAQCKSARFISLQKGPAATQPTPPGLHLEDFSADLKDFQDTAALIANLDLVIAVDTAVAHLAAAMNKPVWLLLPFVPDWRWLLHRTDTPWYPKMKLFRQPTPGDWNSVINQIRIELDK